MILTYHPLNLFRASIVRKNRTDGSVCTEDRWHASGKVGTCTVPHRRFGILGFSSLFPLVTLCFVFLLLQYIKLRPPEEVIRDGHKINRDKSDVWLMGNVSTGNIVSYGFVTTPFLTPPSFSYVDSVLHSYQKMDF